MGPRPARPASAARHRARPRWRCSRCVRCRRRSAGRGRPCELLRQVIGRELDQRRADGVRESIDLAGRRRAVERDDDVKALGTGGLDPARQAQLRRGGRGAPRAASRKHVCDRRSTDRDRRRRCRDERGPARALDQTCGVIVFWLAIHSSERDVGDDRMMDGAVLLRHLDALEPAGKPFDTSFWMNPFLPMPAGIPLHRDRTAADVRHHHRRHGLVVARQLALGDGLAAAVAGNRTFSGCVIMMRPSRCRPRPLRLDSGVSRTTSRAALSGRSPSRRGWRSLPCPVHSMNATWTTISGRTQCARSRGRPLARVNGVFGNLERVERARSSSSSLVSKPVPILPAKHEVLAVEVADQQGAETDALALRIGEAADDELLASPRTSSSASASSGDARRANRGAWRSRPPTLRGRRAPTARRPSARSPARAAA